MNVDDITDSAHPSSQTAGLVLPGPAREEDHMSVVVTGALGGSAGPSWRSCSVGFRHSRSLQQSGGSATSRPWPLEG